MMLTKMVVFSVVVLASQLASAQGRILEPSAGKNASVELYDVPGAEQPFKKIAAEQAGFPLAVLAVEGGYRQVRIGGETVWLKSVQMRIEKEAGGGVVCPMGALASTRPTLGVASAAKGCP